MNTLSYESPRNEEERASSLFAFDQTKKVIAGFFLAFTLVIGLGILLVNTQDSQDKRTQADVFDGASLSFSPAQITVQPGVTTSVSIQIDPKQYEVTATNVRLQYDPNKIEVVSVTQGAYFPLELQPTLVDATKGLITASFGHRPGEVLRIVTAPVLTIELKPITLGTSMITVLTDSVATALYTDESVLTTFGTLTITVENGRGATPTAPTGSVRPGSPR
ncbi:MAG: cohesin domain-containing protein [Microgenomates group bacterium]